MSHIPDRAAAPRFTPSTRAGAPRRVGVEIEFLGLDARGAAQAIARIAGGRVDEEDAHAFRVRDTPWGDLAVEMDLRHLHPGRRSNLRAPPLPASVAAWLGTVLAPFVPRELITGPLPPERLESLDGLLAALREAGARGRGAVLFDSLSLHFNIDPPSLDAATLLAYLRAYMQADGELRREIASGWRQSAALPPDYPASYRALVLAEDYRPDLAAFAADYLAANPTRKRALDFLPVLSALVPDQVRAALPREKIGARPVLHYRLPQAHLGDPGWSLMPDWHRWLRVEALAAETLARRASMEPGIAGA